MAKYLLLLRDRGDEAFASLSPEEIQAVIGKYIAWGERLRAAGKYLDSDKLKDGEGRVIARRGDKLSVTQGPYAETRELVGGFYLLQASSYDEAVQLSQECPHLEFGTIEVREIEPVG